jgi:hypothetical protein
MAPHRLQERNAATLADLPVEDKWPWLVRGMFALPGSWPEGTYRTQVIHFGASLKDEPRDRSCWDLWLGKFESLLRKLYWLSATVHLQTEFEPDRVFRWLPTRRAIDLMVAEPPQPIDEWEFLVQYMPHTVNE